MSKAPKLAQLYCEGCEKITEHRPKLSIVMSANMVCNKCNRMNPICGLFKPDNKTFLKCSNGVKWVLWNEDGTFNSEFEKPIKGASLLMSPFSKYYTWLTTPIKEVVEVREDYVRFKTQNSDYILRLPLKIEYDEETKDSNP